MANFPMPARGCGLPAVPAKDPGGCGGSRLAGEGSARLAERFRKVLPGYGLAGTALESFVYWLEVAIVVKDARRGSHVNPGDILTLICEARDAGDLDEAAWRAFLAAYFGRASMREGQRDSAFALLCGFTEKPVWTWRRVSADPKAFEAWLTEKAAYVAQLGFGNHRKPRSRFDTPRLWRAINSFLREVAAFAGSPAKFITPGTGKSTDQDRFHDLYTRVDRVWTFGRLGSFDFVELIGDLGLARVEAGSCYLDGATGPKSGAILLFGKRPVGELDRLAVQLARDLGVLPAILEDALCNWQK